MKNIIYIAFLVLFIFSCKKPKEEDPYKDYFRGTFSIVTTVSNSCGLVLRIDADKKGGNYLATHPINLDKEYKKGDTLWLQYKMLPDSFRCQIYGGVVGGDFDREFVKIEVLNTKE